MSCNQKFQSSLDNHLWQSQAPVPWGLPSIPTHTHTHLAGSPVWHKGPQVWLCLPLPPSSLPSHHLHPCSCPTGINLKYNTKKIMSEFLGASVTVTGLQRYLWSRGSFEPTRCTWSCICVVQVGKRGQLSSVKVSWEVCYEAQHRPTTSESPLRQFKLKASVLSKFPYSQSAHRPLLRAGICGQSVHSPVWPLTGANEEWRDMEQLSSNSEAAVFSLIPDKCSNVKVEPSIADDPGRPSWNLTTAFTNHLMVGKLITTVRLNFSCCYF